MKKNYLVLVSIVLLIASCGTPSKTIKKEQLPPPSPPEGITFTGVKNYKTFAFINYPYGSGFTRNQDVDIDRNTNDANEFIPGIKFKGEHVSIWSLIRDTDGDLDVQFEAVKKKSLHSHIKENSIVDFEKKQIGNRDVALIRIVTPLSRGGVNYSYGYIVAHNEHTASMFLLYDVNIYNEEEVQEYEATLDKAFIYMIKTVEFR